MARRPGISTSPRCRFSTQQAPGLMNPHSFCAAAADSLRLLPPGIHDVGLLIDSAVPRVDCPNGPRGVLLARSTSGV